ncbi:N(2)-fixation sustaining protein CowN [Pleomorphomonas oryzae]|uniref:N(2)-fixation sustaining protein CowN n=1 Tax=Pleomorphomonas oryzae TaxID=261934 RepID=UPI0004102B19|nr:N(2)-fixation sustaining protein CowN [Pleomorphomonas oryzae]
MPSTDHPATNRYVTFQGIDFEGNIEAVLVHLRRYIDDPAVANPFWERFRQRLATAEQAERPMADRLLLMHAHLYYMAELFEDNDDTDALVALHRLEDQCF